MLDFSKTRISFNRKLTDYSKIQWLMTKLLQKNRLFYSSVRPGSYLNLGCGPNINKDFVNIDADWKAGLDVCCDITNGLPLADGAANGIFTEHCLEHLSLEAARGLMSECWRVLAPKSFIRIIVPDLELYGRTYVQSLDGVEVTFPNEYFVNRTNVRQPVALINELFYGSGHRFIYDFHSLADLIGEAGFRDIKRCSFGTGSDRRLLIDSPGRRSESLYVEARKD